MIQFLVLAPPQKKLVSSWAVGKDAFNPALGRQRQKDLSEFKDILIYRISSRMASAITQRNFVPKHQRKKKGRKENLVSSIQHTMMALGKPQD